MMKKMAFCGTMMIWMLAAGSLSAAEYFADAVNGSDANDGLTEATAKLSLKAALALANTGDTVTLLPGDYSNGVETTSSTYSRGYINKQITLRSKNGRASRDVTRIVGKYDYEGGTGTGKTGGMGDNAVRGLWVTSAAAGTVIEGISFVDCSAPFLEGAGDATCGGGIYFGNGGLTSTAADNLYVVDCAFIRCQATRGAGMYGGTSVRCLFKSCRHTKYGAGQRAGSTYNCIFDDCCVVPGLGQDTKISGGVLGYMRYVVNCTVVNCEPRVASMGSSSPSAVYNCIFQNNYDTALPQHRVFNCVTDTSTMTSNGCAVSVVYSQAEVWSPMDDDYRVNAGAKALTNGSASWLSQIPESYRDMDYNGNPRTTDGTVYCGAVQEAAAAKGSGLAFRKADWAGTLTMDGKDIPTAYRTWFQRDDWPFTLHFAFTPSSSTKGVLQYVVGDSYYWPLPDDSIDILPFEKYVKTLAVSVVNTVHVDPVSGDDANDGSSESPYRTLQKAVDRNVDTLVLARAGDYAEGETFCDGSNRVYVSSTKTLRVKAVAGAENTFITGAADPEPAVANNYGLGPKAVRCIGAVTNANCCFQGFTLRGGRTDYLTGDASSQNVFGAALLNSYGITSLFRAVLADCVITNCICSRGVVFGGAMHRSLLTECRVTKLGLIRSVRAVASIFRQNRLTSGNNLVGQASRFYNCTVVSNEMTSISGGYGKIYNCVVSCRVGGSADISGSSEELKYTLYGQRTVETDATTVKEWPTQFVSPETGDWRLLESSAGATLGQLDYLINIGYPPTAYDRTPFAITSDGRIPAGALNVRPAANIYVDAAGGDDAAGDGTTEGTAYKTLAAALATAQPGDTVVALPGVYASGSAVPTATQAGSGNTVPTIAARAVVPARVTLESRDGPETTVIEGAAATTDVGSDGCGTDAVRCVFLCAGATVRGFTLYNGHTDSIEHGENDSVNNHGGGVLAANATSYDAGLNALAENCVFTNCCAVRGGGAFCGKYRKCRFYKNTASKPGGGVYYGQLQGCLLDNNGTHSAVYKSKLYNCTVLHTSGSGAPLTGVNNESSNHTAVNTILGLAANKIPCLTNCAYSATARNSYTDFVDVNPAVGDLLIGSDGVPMEGSVAIDAGDVSYLPETLGDTDLAGGQRVYNGRLDIGCFEFDWRPKYAADLGKGVTVATASPEVFEGEGGVVTLPGGSLEMGWSNVAGKNRAYSGTMRVTGNGTLTVTRGGETFDTVTAADGERMFQFFSAAALEQLAFAYTPGEGDTGAALLYGFNASTGLTIILR